MIFILTLLAERGEVSADVLNMITSVTESIKIDVASAIGTIATAIIARYGVREFSANWKGIKYDSETEKGENAESTN